MGRHSTDITEQKFGLLTAIKKAEKDKYNHIQWQCLCECGGEKTVRTGDLLTGRVKSCGCQLNPKGENSKSWKGGKVEVPCANPLCNKTKLIYPARKDIYDKFYCSTECRTAVNGWNNRPPQPVIVRCAYCKKEKEILPCHAATYEKHFCKGGECKAAWCSENFLGNANPNYHGGTPEMRKVRRRISGAMRKAIRQEKAGRTWESLVEYSMADLIDRLKETVPDGYSWENDFINGKGVLHIDHMKPMSSFRFETAEDDNFKQCFALENLQLLPAIENMKKSAKLNYQSI